MAETIGESVEDMMDDAVPEERTNDAKEDREEQSNEESAKQRRLHRERQLSNWVSQHRVVRADLVRSILACQALDFLGSAFRSGSRQKLARLHRKSKATKSIDEFWSHSWQKRPYQKVMSLLFLKNGFAASLLGTIAASIVFALMHYGFLPLIRLSDDITSSTKVPAGQPFLCTVTGTLVAVLTLFTWRSRAKVFLDIACIDQVDVKNKTEGIVSLGGILNKSKTLLILWDDTYIDRLWCVFEIAAFAHRSGEPRTTIKPTLLGKAALAIYAATPATALLWLEMMHIKYRDVSMYFMVAAFVPTFYLGVASFRSYHYSIEILRKQLQNFRLAETKCNCCTVGHVAPDGSSMSCDRKVVEQCICNWFGSIEEFEVFIVPLLRRTFENELGQHTFPYVYFLVVFCPVIWTGMDLSLGHRWGHWWMFQLTGFWLGIMPSVAKVGLYLSSFFCRPLPCRVCDMLLNLVIVLVLNLIWAAAIFIAAILNPKNPHRMKVAWVDELPKDMTIRAFLVLVAFCIPAVVLFFVPTVIRAVCSRLARLTRNSVQPSQLQVPKNGP